MRNKIYITGLILLAFLSQMFVSCDKKQHEVILNVEGDTVNTTFIQVDTIRDTVLTILEHEFFVNLDSQEIKDVLVSIEENTANETEIIAFTNTEVSYSLVSGEGFRIFDEQLLVSDEGYLDFESRQEISLIIQATSGDTVKEFNVLVLLEDVVDVPELKAHVDFDNQDLIERVSGESLELTGSIFYSLKFIEWDNYYANLNNSGDSSVLVWDNKILDLGKDFSICFFADHKFKAAGQTETLIAGYDNNGMEIIRIFFEDVELKLALNGTAVPDLVYTFNNFNDRTEARAALIKEGDQYSIRVNSNGVSEVINSTVLNEVTSWSMGANKTINSSVSNGYTGKLDNLRFYQKALTEAEYNSVVSVDF